MGAKPVITSFTSGVINPSQLNSNLDILAEAIADTLDRAGDSDTSNQMSGDLDMGGYNIVNVGDSPALDSVATKGFVTNLALATLPTDTYVVSDTPVAGAIPKYDADGHLQGINIISRVETIADLRLLVGDFDGQVVQVMGYYTVGDGGGGPPRRWDAVSVVVDNAGSIVQPTAVVGAGRWVFHSEIINPLEYGARGDGTTDDTLTFNSCPSGNVVIPPGDYVLQGFIPKSNTRYSAPSGATFSQGSAITPIVAISASAQNICFEGISFSGDPTSSSGACAIFDNNETTFRNEIKWVHCTFDNFGGMALVCAGLKGALIEDCRFIRTAQLNIPMGTSSYPAIWLSDASVGVYSAASNIQINNCTFSDMYWSGIYALGNTIQIKGSRFKNTRESSIFINLNASKVSVIGNIFSGTTLQNISASAVEVGGYYTEVIGNTITGAELYGISVQDCMFFNVTGNICSFNGSGIVVISSSAVQPPRYGAIKGNTLTNNTQYGMLLMGVGEGVVITDCDFSGNQAVTNGIRDIHLTVATPLVGFNSRMNYNTTTTSQEIPTDLDLGALGTGEITLLSLPFRPSAIMANCVKIGVGPRSCLGHVHFDATGSIRNLSKATSEAGAVASSTLITMVGSPTSTKTLSVVVTGVVYNTTTGLWDVAATIATNDGASYSTTLTARP